MEDRTPIPGKLSAEVMYASDSTCCVCTERGKCFQIHHIDGNRGNNIFENLAVLCTECHEKTQWRGGFTRKLTPNVVIEYRNNWIKRVSSYRKKRDEMVVSMQESGEGTSLHDEDTGQSLRKRMKFKIPREAFINSLPDLKAKLLADAQPKWDSGVTSTMVQATCDYIDSVVAILIVLSSYYSTNPFGNQSPEEYFSEIISSRFRWHRSIAEPGGSGTGGTMVSLHVTCSVQADDVFDCCEEAARVGEPAVRVVDNATFLVALNFVTVKNMTQFGFHNCSRELTCVCPFNAA